MSAENFSFQAEVSKILHIVTNSLYSDKEIFLRELIANASDACDKLRYLSLTQADLLKEDQNFKILLTIDKENKTLTITDNGIGMNKEDLKTNLGTIAHSGTARFIEQLKNKSDSDNMIGQFGVGFYSAFIVAEKIIVHTLKADENQAYCWSSTGTGEFSIDVSDKKTRGTEVILYLKEEESEFLEPMRLETIIKKYSDHIAVPLYLTKEEKEEQINTASALWTRSKSDITQEQYKEFYHHTAHMYDDPKLTFHYKVEGMISYSALLFVPSSKPYDLFHPDRQNHLKLYIKRVFITDNCKDLLPSYLRFVRGVVDSDDLQLNVSREMLQKNPILSKIRKGLIKKILGELEKTQKNDHETYMQIWENFGAVLKEGLYEDPEIKDTLLKICYFDSALIENKISLADYIKNMPEAQKDIYYITGDSKEAVAVSPQIEGFKEKNIDVLLLTDPIDEFWVSMVQDYEGKSFKSITRSSIDLEQFDAQSKEKDQDKKDSKETSYDKKTIEVLRGFLKTELKDQVADVKISHRLTSSAVCLVSEEGQMDIRLERMLKQQGKDITSKKILEINPTHLLVKKMAENFQNRESDVKKMAYLLYNQALLLEGEKISSPKDFTSLMNDLLVHTL